MSLNANVSFPPIADSSAKWDAQAATSDSEVVCGRGMMKLYRIDKVARLGGISLKKKHVLAASDRDALKQAEASIDCPVCEVIRDDGKPVGTIT